MSFERYEEGKAVLCPVCGEIISVPEDEHSPRKTRKTRTRPSPSEGRVKFDTYLNESRALQMQAILNGNGVKAGIIDGTGTGVLPNLSVGQGFSIIIDAKDWDRAIELEREADGEPKVTS